ncbi:MAG: GAF domain-containing protein [Alphaproteobacteria bacterium]|nr:MAG: GAF domain-containing protein [Alphaproteobacteria bacterium]
MTYKDKLNQCWELTRNEITRLSIENKYKEVLGFLIIPVFMGLWSNVADQSTVGGFIFWGPLVLAGLVQIVFLAPVFRKPYTISEAYELMKDGEQEIKALRTENKSKANEISLFKSAIEYFVLSYEISRGWIEMFSEWIQEDICTVDDMKYVVRNSFDSVVKNRKTLFGLSEDEHWEFAVYLNFENEAKLKPIFRVRSENHPSITDDPKYLGREWNRGEGHIGSVFSGGVSVIVPDATLPEVKKAFPMKDELRREYDDEVYRARAMILIGPINDQNQPKGVLIATSSRPNRFSEINAIILHQYAQTLASAMSQCQIAELEN